MNQTFIKWEVAKFEVISMIARAFVLLVLLSGLLEARLLQVSTGQKDVVRLLTATADDAFDRLQGVAISPNGKLVACGTGTSQTVVVVMEGDKAKVQRVQSNHSASVRAIAFVSNDEVASGDAAGSIVCWGVKDGRQRLAIQTNAGPIRHLGIDNLAASALSCHHDGTIGIWNLKDGSKRLLLRAHNKAATACVLLDDNSILASVGLDGTLKRWQVSTGKMLDTTTLSQQPLRAIAYHSSRGELVIGGDDRVLRVVQANTGKVAREIRQYGEIASVDVSADGKWILSGVKNGGMYLYATTPFREVDFKDAHDGTLHSVKFRPLTTHAVSAASSLLAGELKVWEIPSPSK